MGSPTPKRRLVIPAVLLGCGLALCGWQIEEHLRFKRAAAEALINRGRDITSTLGVVIRSQRRFGPVTVVFKDRLQFALNELVRPEELESIAILGSTGETIASAGKSVELTPAMLEARGVYWRDRSLMIMNLMDLSATASENGTRSPAAIIVNDERTARAFGPQMPPRRRGSTDGANRVEGEEGNPAANVARRPTFGRPPWMSQEEYDSVIEKQGMHSLVISLSTDDMHRSVNADLLLRSLVSLLAMGGAVISTLAWRNVGKNSELQIRLVKAGEMNTHLKEMNLAAAGLAHETRNPLNIIRGMAQMIAMQSKETPKLKEHASIIVEEADRVTVQLNEFINYSKPREVQMAPVELKGLVADVARTLLPDLEEKQIQLQQPETPLMVEADAQLLRQALFNVLLNATQAVGAGGKIDVRFASAGTREAVLEIADDGPGVAEADRASIFKPYVTMRPKGVGLGLAIVAQIVAVHHWEIRCEANGSHGAVFRFTGLKLAAVPA